MLKGILAISGQSGLFKLIAESKNNIIVESLETGKRMPAYSTTKISALEDISIYTDTADVPLKDVFKVIHEKEEGGAAISHKSSPKELKAYLTGDIPRYQIPSDFVFVNHLPVGGTGKISRQMIRRNAIQHNTKNNHLSSKPQDDL